MWDLIARGVFLLFFVGSFGTVGGFVLRNHLNNLATKKKQREDMLDILRRSTTNDKAAKTLATNYSKSYLALKEIARVHVDSREIPGFCATCAEPYPCTTRSLADKELRDAK